MIDELSSNDAQQLAKVGIGFDEAQRQLALLRTPPPPTKLNRACKIGDGILKLTEAEQERFGELGQASAKQGRVSKFVPASGAASRMFASLAAISGHKDITTFAQLEDLAQVDDNAKHALEVLNHRQNFAFFDTWQDLVTKQDSPRAWIETLLKTDGLRLSELPKGLIPFHKYPRSVRTAFEEHLAEAALTVQTQDNTCAVHFTVNQEFQKSIDRALQNIAAAHHATRFEITYSKQHPSTDTLAIDGSGKPFRLENGALLLRPGGHGALVENLNALGGDIVCIKNIDNIEPDWRRDVSVHWQLVLIGVLSNLQSQGFALLEEYSRKVADFTNRAQTFFKNSLLVTNPPNDADVLAQQLKRPWRVCGVVPNEGEPGGGPFWVEDDHGNTSMQIVESAQIDFNDAKQASIASQATHFNPVNLVCALRDRNGKNLNLNQFIDHDCVFIANKSADGKSLKALERPGLWNGAMANWNTVFVEMPLETFNPVKTVLDLLRPAHQPPTDG